jgi:NTP pyrophosphatase (non-canonical NTP hydrolase)
MDDLERLRDELRAFSAARDWDQFHSPKNLAMALAGEAAEILEIFQWLTEAQSTNLDAKQLQATRDEIADILLYLVRIADRLGIDPAAEARRKLQENERKYPVEKSRGNAKKYTEL